MMAQPNHNHQPSTGAADFKEGGGTFPVKLHNMLEKVQGTTFEEIINWDPDGMSFVVYRPKEFADQLMGIYFKHTKYKSFQRQLNFYGFVRTRRGIIRGVYSHPLFQRDKPHLCQRMRRMDSNNNEPSCDSNLRQQNVMALMHHASSSPSLPSMMSSNNHLEQAFPLGRSNSSSLEPSSLINMHNNLSPIRRLQQDDDSIETIDELPFGCTPCVVKEDDSF